MSVKFLWWTCKITSYSQLCTQKVWSRSELLKKRKLQLWCLGSFFKQSVKIKSVLQQWQQFPISAIYWQCNHNKNRNIASVTPHLQSCENKRGFYACLILVLGLLFQTTSSVLKGAIQLGIGYTVGNLSSKPDRDVLMQDFYVVESVFLPRWGPRECWDGWGMFAVRFICLGAGRLRQAVCAAFFSGLRSQVSIIFPLFAELRLN